MTALMWCFWICTGVVVYTYVGYPLLVWLLGRLVGRAPVSLPAAPATISIILAARNEEGRIATRLVELQALLQSSGLEGEILVISDGSTDRTVQKAREVAGPSVRVVELPQSVGKAAALTQGCKEAKNELFLFADVRQTWPPEAIPRLVEMFADPAVGGVSGELILEESPGVLAGVGLYWKFEKWLRRQESRLYSMVGATGSISAVRAGLFQPIPPGTLLDDVYWPMQVVLQGYRVVHNPEARAFDRLPPRARDEFRRKVRTLAGNFQLVGLLPDALLPWKNRIWLQFVSHKLLRLVVPWCLLIMLAASFFLGGVLLYGGLFAAQLGIYALGVVGLVPGPARRWKLISAASSFLVLNAAAWVAFWVWITGRAKLSWGRVNYLKAEGTG